MHKVAVAFCKDKRFAVEQKSHLFNIANKHRLCLFFPDENLNFLEKVRSSCTLLVRPVRVLVHEVPPPFLTEINGLPNQHELIVLPEPGSEWIENIDIWAGFPDEYANLLRPLLAQGHFFDLLRAQEL